MPSIGSARRLSSWFCLLFQTSQWMQNSVQELVRKNIVMLENHDTMKRQLRHPLRLHSHNFFYINIMTKEGMSVSKRMDDRISW